MIKQSTLIALGGTIVSFLYIGVAAETISVARAVQFGIVGLFIVWLIMQTRFAVRG